MNNYISLILSCKNVFIINVMMYVWIIVDDMMWVWIIVDGMMWVWIIFDDMMWVWILLIIFLSYFYFK